MPITLADMIRKLPTTINLTTLGNKSSFDVVNRSGVVTIINSGGNSCRLTDAIVNDVYNRYIALKVNGAHLTPSQYTPPAWNWGFVPDHIFAPYIARVIAYIEP